MGFYHYLQIKDGSNTKHDIGGYSKGGTKLQWFYAFSPTEYRNNLEDAVNKRSLEGVFVGYVTTVGSARKRLKKAEETLFSYQKMFRTYFRWKQLQEDIHMIIQLLQALKQFDDQETLILDQTDDAPYRVKWQDGIVVGLENGWYSNGAYADQRIAEQKKASENLSVKTAVRSFSKQLPELKEGFYDELRLFCAEAERGCGPTLFTEFIDAVQGAENEPRLLYEQIVFGLLELTPEEIEKRGHFAEGRAEYIMQCLETVFGLMEETLAFIEMYEEA